MATRRKDVGQVLLEKGVVSQEDLQKAYEVQRQTRSPLESILVDMEFATQQQVLEAKAEVLGVQFVDLRQVAPDPAVARRIPEHMLRNHNAIPIALQGNRLTVAMADPTDIVALDDLRMMGGFEIEALLAVEDDILAAIQKTFGSGDQPASEEEVVPAQAPEVDDFGSLMRGAVAELEQGDYEAMAAAMEGGGGDSDARLAEQAPIIRFVNTIILQAIKDGASDIHVEPQRRNTRVRYRIDGVLHEIMTVPRYLHPPLISRVKIMSDMDIAERRVPQDGRIGIRHSGKDYDLRVSVVPSIVGEKSVMRILDKSSVLIGLNKLGIFPDTQAHLEELIMQPNGILLSTGPTGSGKTTTQYSVLNKINTVEKNTMTVEDPVEYQLPGLTQVAVNRKAGLVFSNALRSFLRQDPDIIMVGEIRDLETAEIAIQASLTGHLVLSTLHTNDAPSTITRLVDMGVEPFLVAASLLGSLAQRLVRRICSNCKVPYQPPMESLQRFGFEPDPDNPIVFYRGEGCDLCRHTGFKGRTGIYELMMINDEIAEMIVRRASLVEIREAATANGMRSLQQDGLKKVLEGMTTIDEVMRVVISVGR